MENFVIKELANNNLESELKQIGFDEGYRFIACEKFRYKNIKIFDLTPAQANVLKQTALTVGADCATHREVIRGNIDKSNAILGGSISQLKKISEKLNHQPFNLKNLASQIESFLNQKREVKTKLAGILNGNSGFFF